MLGVSAASMFNIFQQALLLDPTDESIQSAISKANKEIIREKRGEIHCLMILDRKKKPVHNVRKSSERSRVSFLP